jgi:hypothetical protein
MEREPEGLNEEANDGRSAPPGAVHTVAKLFEPSLKRDKTRIPLDPIGGRAYR